MNTPPLPAPLGDDADLLAYADLLARFAHRFADRGGILDARGLAEGDFARLEAAALARLEAAAAVGDHRTLHTFARAVILGRNALAPTSSEPSTRAAPTHRDDLEHETVVATPTMAPGLASGLAPQAPAAVVDLADLMATLHSEAARPR